MTARGAGPTERLTVAWVAALLAVALLAITGAVLASQTLDQQRTTSRILQASEQQRDHARELLGVAGEVTAAGSSAQRRAAVAGLMPLLNRFDRAHLALRHGDPQQGLPTTAGTSTAALFASVDRQHGQALSAGHALLRRLEPPDGEQRALLDPSERAEQDRLAADLAGAAERYLAGMDQAVRALTAELDDAAEEAQTLVPRLLAGVLLLLAIEAFLVFRPATRRIRVVLETRQEQQEAERRAAREQLESLARFDPLTGLANRAVFRERLEHGVATAERSGQQLAVMFLDLDRFKDVNDQYGHAIGDELLVAVAGRLRGCARRIDTVARVGGDEFTLAIEGLDSPTGAATVAQKILDAFAQPFDIGGREIRSSTSIGISLYPNDGETVDELLRHADSAMYQAKSAGRGSFQFSTPELRAANVERLRTVAGLRSAVRDEQLTLLFQPQAGLRSGRIEAVEALVRWVREDGTLVAASAFMEVAEETGLILPLGAWALREACRVRASWAGEEGLEGLRVAVNLSARQFRQTDLGAIVAAAIEASRLPEGVLEVEIDEASLAQETEQAGATLRILRGLGVPVVVDHFGAGGASLRHLREVPVDALKVDRSLLVGADGGDDGAGVMHRAIAALARDLGMRTIAEGIETPAQLRIVRQTGCDLVQGLAVAPLVSADDVPAAVRRSHLAAL